jgi:hypothetical protein
VSYVETFLVHGDFSLCIYVLWLGVICLDIELVAVCPKLGLKLINIIKRTRPEIMVEKNLFIGTSKLNIRIMKL